LRGAKITRIWVKLINYIKIKQAFKAHIIEVSTPGFNFKLSSLAGMISLIQISTTLDDLIIDPFPTFSRIRKTLGTLMCNVGKLKVFCGGANDFQWMQRDYEVLPVSVLDIQVLHKLMEGQPIKHPSKGLSGLCIHYLGVEPTKGQAMRDWRRRPLEPEMLKYAQSDSYYTLAVYYKMKETVCSCLVTAVKVGST